jgi:hypothetical protein
MKTYTILIVCFLFNLAASAQIDEKVKRTFETSTAPQLSIDNSFGDITIKKHKQSIIDVLIEINVVPKKSRDYDKVKDKVHIEINEVGDRVELTTVNDLNGMSTEELEIDYTVSIPENTSLEIRNQFGDVWIEGTEGKVYARVQHGDFFCGNVGGSENSIKVQFGELRLQSMKDAELETQHGDFRASRLQNVEVEIQFGDAEIDEIDGELDIDIQHSDLSIEKCTESLRKLEIDAQFSDIDLGSGMWDMYNMELEGSFTDFSLPSSIKSLINYESKDLHSKEYRINEKISDRKIIIEANHSNVDFD